MSARNSRRVTISDIAEKTQLSVSMVSRILNNKPCRVSTEKREQVIKLARELHYVPNQIARSLLAHKTKTFGLIVPSIESRTFTSLIQSFEHCCQIDGYGLFIMNSSDKKDIELGLLDVLIQRGVDGIFIVPSNESFDRPELPEQLDNLYVPFVMISRYLQDYVCDQVYFDNEQGGYLAAQHLIHAGYRRIACIANTEKSNTGRQRYKGYLRALREADIEVDQELLVQSEYSMQGGYDAAKILLDKHIDAIVSGSDYIALGARKAFAEAGLRVPDDYGIVCFDQSESDFLFDPSCDCVLQDMEQMARDAYSIMKRKIECNDGTWQTARVIHAPHLELNGSVLSEHTS